MDIKGTRTAENLRKALAGESIARNKYTYFAMAARARRRPPLSRWRKTR
jgi:rubrerythrin